MASLLSLPADPLRSPTGPVALPPAGAGPGCYAQPHGGPQGNGRAPGVLPEGSWHPTWVVPWTPLDPPRFVLQAGDRVLVQSVRWGLYDLDGGEAVSDGRTGLSDVVLDPGSGLFYLVDGDGYLTGRSLRDGRKTFASLLAFGDAFGRSFLAVHGQRLFLAGSERALDPHGHQQPERSLVEALDLGRPPQADEIGLLASGKRLDELHVDGATLHAALADPLFVLAVPGCLVHLGLDLRIRRAYADEFDPVALSLDAHGYAYLVVQVEDRLQYWLVAPDGLRLVQLVLPPPLLSIGRPPVVGYDRQVYLVANGIVVAISPEGRLAWARPVQDPVGGVVVTADRQLLVADGEELAAFDATGQRRVLYRFDGETLRTPPVLTPGGSLLVATDRRLVRLDAA